MSHYLTDTSYFLVCLGSFRIGGIDSNIAENEVNVGSFPRRENSRNMDLML